MKVICAGLPKTGTKSLCAALRILGLKVYDFEEQAWYIGSKLRKALEYGCTKEEYQEMLAGVDAVTDAPCCFLWEDISAAFPEAKIILCVRNTEEEWLKSFNNLVDTIKQQVIWRFIRTITYTGHWAHEYGNSMVRVGLGQCGTKPWLARKVNQRVALKRYREHNCYVLQTVSEEKLLFFNLSDGWKPLCQFLNVPMPNQEFPFCNKKAIFVKQMRADSLLFLQIKTEFLAAISIFIGLITYAFYAYLL